MSTFFRVGLGRCGDAGEGAYIPVIVDCQQRKFIALATAMASEELVGERLGIEKQKLVNCL